jgi:NAD(P)-dependent dehydrogenase (short-subunit alcohol dehydrogenase family)
MALENRIAVVTGGGQGIGRQIALRLAQSGASVVIADINEEGAHQTREMIAQSSGPEATVVCTDIRGEAQVAEMIEATLALDGRIDILVNNSGIMGPVKFIEDIILEEWEETMAVNMRGMFLCCKHAVPIMKKQGRGCIVNISSVTGKRALTERTPYAASKMGVIGLTRTLAAEVGKWNIRANSICPGAVTGPRFDKVMEGVMKFSGKSREQAMSDRAAASALNTFVDPKYVAGLVAFLCSDDAAMITGQDINVCAGSIMY